MTAAYRAPAPFGMRYHAYVEPDSPHRVRAPVDDRSSTRHAPSDVDLPRVDDHIVRPETREELVRGRAIMAMPAKAPHAERHFLLDFITGGAVASGYIGATDLLTCTGHESDFATDTCIRREGIDPSTGGRYLEELAFEVVAEQPMHEIIERAQDLTARGVRRMIAIFVKKGEVCEWSRERDAWIPLDPNGVLEDPTLVEPIPIRALLDRAAADDAVAQALLAKRNPVLVANEAKVRAQVFEKTIAALCGAFGIPLDPERRALLHTLDATRLEALHDTVLTERRWP